MRLFIRRMARSLGDREAAGLRGLLALSSHVVRVERPRLRGVAALVAVACAAFGLVVGQASAATQNHYEMQFSGKATGAEFFFTTALALDSNENVFTDDAEHGVIDEFAPITSLEPAPVREFKHGGEELHSEGIATNAAGDLFVGEFGAQVVYEFAPDGTLLRDIHGTNTSAGSFYPTGIATNASGDLYVADYEHGVVDEFAPSAYESSPTGAPLAEYAVTTPNFVAVSATNGDLYVTGYESGGVHVFEPGGALRPFTAGEAPTPLELPVSPAGVAVAPSGDVYIADVNNDVVDRFTADGSYLSQFDGHETPQESFAGVNGLAVNAKEQVYVSDGGHEVVDIFGAPEAEAAEGQWATEPASEATETTATLHGSVDPEGAPVTTCEFEYGSSSSYGAAAPCDQSEGQIGEGTAPVSVSAKLSGLNPGATYHFRVVGDAAKGSGQGIDETFTTMATPPTPTIKPVTGTSAHCATFNGEVDPDGFATSYQFEDSTNGTEWTALARADIGEGTAEIPVHEEVCGLAGSSAYRVRLKADNAGGEVTSGEAMFTTTASAPQLNSVGATALAGNEATLYATIDPEGQQTKYHIEYGSTASYGQTVPAGDGDAGTTPSQVDQTVAELVAGTTYHFRFVATNGTGTIYGDDETFTTPVIAASAQVDGSGTCTNEAVREESNIGPHAEASFSSQLPDCRAYEQVTPPFKGGNGVGTGGLSSLAGETIAVEGLSLTGSPLLAVSLVPLGHAQAGTDGELNPTAYELSRTTTAWTTTGETPPASNFATATHEWSGPGDAGTGLWSAATPAQSINAEDFYRRGSDGIFVDIGPLAPPAATTGPPHGSYPGTHGISRVRDAIVGASANLDDVVYQLESPEQSVNLLWPGDSTASGEHPSLYEYVGTGHTGEGPDVPSLVGVDNQGAQIGQCGTGLADKNEKTAQDVRNGISAAGSTVFFNVQARDCRPGTSGPATPQLYARIGTPPNDQATVNVAGTAGCAASASCNLTSAVTYRGASSDGSKVFFTAAQAGLVPSDSDGTTALYECDLPGDGGATPLAEGIVDSCPALHALSLTGTSEGADVQQVLAVSEEGSRAYFTARGVLTQDANGQGHAAQAGQDNLYLWEATGTSSPAGRIVYIATLPTPAPNEVQATPNGRYFVFTTPADLTPDDTSGVAQAFRYDAQTGELLRISTGQSGFNDNGNTNSYPTSLAKGRREPNTVPRTISEDGAYIAFQTSDALTPQVDGGKNNVYEWHEGNVRLISDGVDSTDRPGLVGMDASAQDIFFVTADGLVGQDDDQDYDVYDARVNGGFPAPVPPATCSGETCQGPLTSNPFSTPVIGSLGTPSIGNLPLQKPKPATKTAKVAVTKHSLKGSAITLSVRLTGAGRLSLSGADIKTVTRTVARAGTYKLKFALKRAGIADLRKHHRLKLNVKLHLVPTSGKASSTTITLTLHALASRGGRR